MISCGLVLLSVLGTSAQTNAFTSTQHMGSKATVMVLDGKTTLRLEAPNVAARLLPLGDDWKRFSLLRFSQDGSRLAMIGEAATEQAAIVDVPTGRMLGTFPIAAAAISPDARALILEHARKPKTLGAVRFSLIPLAAAENVLSAGSTAFDIHTDGRDALRLSDFVWVDPEVVTFIEHSGTEPRLVALQVDSAGQIQKRAEKTLPADVFADASLFKDRLALAQAISGVEITRVPSAGLTLRLTFPAKPALKTSTTDVAMWE